jgi:hypothetical protein
MAAPFQQTLPYRTDLAAPLVFLLTTRHGPTDNTIHLHIHCQGNVFTELFPTSGRLFSLIRNLLPSNGHRSVVCFTAIAWKRMLFQSHSLATAVSLAAQILLWANMPQYLWKIPLMASVAYYPFCVLRKSAKGLKSHRARERQTHQDDDIITLFSFNKMRKVVYETQSKNV